LLRFGFRARAFPDSMVPMGRTERHPLIAGTVITSLGTLASRLLGLLRERATSSLFGLAGKGVADALLFAFRIPNLFRQLFGEGALSASYLPVLTGQLDDDPNVARHISSVVVTLLIALLASVAAVGELLLGLIWLIWGNSPRVDLLVGLSAVMMPYVVLICLAAQLSTMLYAHHRFAVPALAPTMLNIVWLLAAWVGYEWFPENQIAQAYLLAVGVIVSGVAQVAVHLPTLRRLGFHFDYNWSSARKGVTQIGRNMTPTFVGLSVLQINTFVNSLIAWGLAATTGGPQTISWLAGVQYPMQQGAVASLYFSDRLCDFTLGIVGLPVAVAIFPLLCRHADRGDHRQMGTDMTLGLRLVLCLSIPAGVGLILLAQPITRLILEHGHFGPKDTDRVAWLIYYYGAAVWANCAWPVVVRGFYALNDLRTPVRVCVWVVSLNLVLNLTLIWPLAEAGLALSTTVATVVQLFILMAKFSRRQAPLDWRALAATSVRALLATAAMAGVVCTILPHMPTGDRLIGQVTHVVVPIILGAAAYCGAYLLLGGRELGMLWSGKVEN
jgi:putative peptidoglycan lipid II flippase